MSLFQNAVVTKYLQALNQDSISNLKQLIGEKTEELVSEQAKLSVYQAKIHEIESKLKEETVNIAVQINGKVKVQLSVDPNADKDTVLAAAKAALGDKLSGNIVKEIYVPGRIVNIVVK